MDLLEAMKKKQTTENTKGGEYYTTSYDSNLDVFTMLSRFQKKQKILATFHAALEENETLALANLLYLLDIRKGKGERRLFQTIYQDLCCYYPEQALRILPFIQELGRFDYLLIGIDTPLEKETMEVIKKQLEQDLQSDSPSLLAKWLPSHRTHKEDSKMAKKLMRLLHLTEKEYRKMLSDLRSKLNIVEKNLTNKTYDQIDFSKVPAKAMLKHRFAYRKHMKEQLEKYQREVARGTKKINTTGLFAYEIVRHVLFSHDENEELYNLMWKNQKDVLRGFQGNVLVVSDTSGSMLDYGGIPYATSVGLALYFAERNQGLFHNHFITFSENPTLQEVKGLTLVDKIHNMETINAGNTDVDKVFDLLLKTAVENHLEPKDLPNQILIISDMEFDQGVFSKEGTNFEGWKKAFANEGYELPTILFWNVSLSSRGIPVTKFDGSVSIISGFSTNLFEHLFSLESYTPLSMMIETLSFYVDLLKSPE